MRRPPPDGTAHSSTPPRPATVSTTQGPRLRATFFSTGLLLAFALFRVFDIAKPPPIRRSQFVGGGHGIVLDDALAGLFALALGLAASPFLPN
jgi:hypothetical protein